MTTLLSPSEIASALKLRDLSDPASGPHAMQTLLNAGVEALSTRWACRAAIHRPGALVAVEDNYDRLGYDATDITRDARYVSDTVAGLGRVATAVEVHTRPVGQRPDHVGNPGQGGLQQWRVVIVRAGRDQVQGIPSPS